MDSKGLSFLKEGIKSCHLLQNKYKHKNLIMGNKKHIFREY